MPLSIQPPWPPTDAQPPLPYDQRGACFPIGPCGTTVKLQLRYAAVLFSSVGPVNAIYGRAVGGCTLIIDAPASSRSLPRWVTKDFLLKPADFMTLVAASDDLTLWDVLYQARPGLLPPIFYQATMTESDFMCDATFTVPVALWDGPDNQPEEVRVTPLLWYEASPFPWI